MQLNIVSLLLFIGVYQMNESRNSHHSRRKRPQQKQGPHSFSASFSELKGSCNSSIGISIRSNSHCRCTWLCHHCVHNIPIRQIRGPRLIPCASPQPCAAVQIAVWQQEAQERVRCQNAVLEAVVDACGIPAEKCAHTE